MKQVAKNVVEEVKPVSIPARALVHMANYVNKAGQMVEYVGVTLKNPFTDEDFGDVEIAPKWRDAKGIFEYKAKKMLRTHDDFEIVGEIRINRYNSKLKKRQVSYPAIFMTDPFGGDRPIEFAVRGEENSAVFSMLASEAFSEALDSEATPLAKED